MVASQSSPAGCPHHRCPLAASAAQQAEVNALHVCILLSCPSLSVSSFLQARCHRIPQTTAGLQLLPSTRRAWLYSSSSASGTLPLPFRGTPERSSMASRLRTSLVIPYILKQDTQYWANGVVPAH